MDTFSIIRNALAASENDPDKVGLAQDIIDTGRIVAAVQVVVDALTPPDGGRYIVAFKDIQTAGTSLADHTITVSSKPLRDPSLSIVEKAVVIATFAAHEIGHTFVTRPKRYPVDVVKAFNSHSGFHSVANIADDIILEPFMVERYPILQDAFDFTGAWVLRNTAASLPVTHVLHHGTTAAERFNIILSATRYGDIPEIIWTPGKMTEERDWARDWAERLIALPLTDHDGFVMACAEVWERIREIDPEPEPEPEPEEDEDDDEPEGDDDEPEPLDDNPDGENEQEPPVTECPPEPTGEDPEPGEGEPEPSDEKGEPDEDRQGDDFDEDREDEDGEDDESEPSDDPKGDGDEEKPEPDEPTEGGDEPTEDGDDEDDESEDGDEGDGDEESDDDGDDSDEVTDEKVEHRDENDFNSAEVDKTMHDQAEQTNYDGDLVEQQVRRYSNTTSVRFGQHGSMSINWD